jgi:hypothetical protein
MQSSLRNRAAERRQRSSPRATFPLGETDTANAFGMCVPRSFTCVVWGDTRSITNRVACLRTNARARVAVAASRLLFATTIQPWGLRPMLCAVAASRLIRLVRRLPRPTQFSKCPFEASVWTSCADSARFKMRQRHRPRAIRNDLWVDGSLMLSDRRGKSMFWFVVLPFSLTLGLSVGVIVLVCFFA